MGKGNYEGEWFDKYKHRAEGHNVVLINPDETSGFEKNSLPVLESFASDNDESYAVYDLTKSYVTDITYSGGEPFCQAENLIVLTKAIKETTDKTFWIYS